MSLRERWALASARRSVRKRTPHAWHADPAQRRLLVVLPAEAETAAAAWRFLEGLGLPPERVHPVVPRGDIAFAPVPYIGRTHALGKEELRRIGVPKKAFLKEAWAFAPDVAMDLSPSFDLASAVIAGASPAAFRVGFAAEGAEPFFDLLVAVRETGTYAEALETLAETLGRIEPAVIR